METKTKKVKFFQLTKECVQCKHMTRDSTCKKCGKPTIDTMVNEGETLRASVLELVSKLNKEADHRLILDSKMLDW